MAISIRLILRGVAIIIIASAFSPSVFAEADLPRQPTLVLQAKWGEKESSTVLLGLRLNQGWYEGFAHIAVRAGQIFIADSVFGRIAQFDGNKFVRSYRSPVKWEFGFAIRGSDLFFLDNLGCLHRMNLNTEKTIITAAPVVAEETGILTDGLYSMYSLGDQLVINRSGAGDDVCVDSQSLKITPCVGMPKNYLKEDSSAVVLEGEQYVTTVKDYALLHDKSGAVIARAYWPDSKSLYADPAWLFTTNGIYFTKHAEKVVEIYFQPWEKL